MTALGLIALSFAFFGHGFHPAGSPQFTTGPTTPKVKLPFELEADRVPKTVTHGNVLIRHGKVLTVTHGMIEDGDVLILNGKIAKVGKGLTAPDGVTVIDVTGKFVTPGIVDAHSHRGGVTINEGSDSITADVQMRDVLDADSLGLWYGLANGMTTGLLLHGSANAIGGQSVVIKYRYKKTPSEMVFQGAPRMVKFALGENVTQKNGGGGNRPQRYPATRLGVESVYRRAFNDAKSYIALWDAYNASVAKIGEAETLKTLGAPPRKDLRLEALADILRGKIWVNCHSYLQDEILMMVRLSQEFGFHLGTLQHALEAYKIAPEIKAAGIPVSVFSDSWNYKLEVIDSIPMGASILNRAGILTTVNTDTSNGEVALNVDAGKQMKFGLDENQALALITINAAKQLGVDQHVGSLDEGKDGDVAIWSGHPLSVFSRCEKTILDGDVVFERRDALGVDKLATTEDTVKPNQLRADLLKELPKAAGYALIGGTVHPVNGPEIKNGVVVILGDKIVAVGDAHTAIPKGVLKVPVQGLQVYPGLVDAGSEIGLQEVGSVRQASDADELGQNNPDLHALIAVNPESIKFPIARQAGITTATVVPGGGFLPGQTAVIDLKGFTPEQMSLGSSQLVVAWPEGGGRRFGGGNADASQSDANNPQVLAFKEQLLAAKRAAEAGDLSDPKVAALVPYAQGKKTILFKVAGQRSIKAALAFVKELGLKAVLQGADDGWKVASEIAAAKVPVILTPPSVSSPGEFEPRSAYDPYDAPLANAALLVKAGVKVAFASVSSGEIHDLPYRIGRLCAFGLSKEAAIKALTLDAATILGVGDKLGSLEAGKLANVIVTDGDPLELTTQVLREFVGGEPQKLTSHFTDLYRKYEARLKTN